MSNLTRVTAINTPKGNLTLDKQAVVYSTDKPNVYQIQVNNYNGQPTNQFLSFNTADQSNQYLDYDKDGGIDAVEFPIRFKNSSAKSIGRLNLNTGYYSILTNGQGITIDPPSH